VLDGTAEIGGSVVVLDTQGRPEGATVAEYLADRGHRVEIITGLPFVGREITPIIWHHLLERLMKKGVRMRPFTGVFEILPGGLSVYNTMTWELEEITGVDTVVLATGGQADDRLYRQLKDVVPSLIAIGDCYQPRDIETAVVDGHRVAVEI
jgi:uncharacterized FAD-dependent dehydrogenase